MYLRFRQCMLMAMYNVPFVAAAMFGLGPAGSLPIRAQPAPNVRYFAIEVVDERTGRGVPMVELQTTTGARYYTDSNGLVAFYEPGQMNRKVFFSVASPGYEYPADGFGFHGKALVTKPGGVERLKIK